MYYNGKFDEVRQVDLEEKIGAFIYNYANRDEYLINEDLSYDLGKKILQMIVVELRPDLAAVGEKISAAKKWKISDGKVTEIYED